MYRLWQLLVSASILLASPALAADIVINVTDVRSDAGQVLVALFSDETKDAFPASEAAIRFAGAKASEGAVVVTMEDLPEGTYAISLFHDENDNGELDTNLMGIPTEGFGFSNDARGVMGPPEFDAAALDVSASGMTTTISLAY